MKHLALGFIMGSCAFLSAETAAAQAACRMRDMGRPSVVQSQDGAVQVLLPRGQTGCQVTFEAGGRGAQDYKTTSVSIVTRPRSGAVTTHANGFSYNGGADTFVLRVCGQSRQGKGCANVTYNVTKG